MTIKLEGGAQGQFPMMGSEYYQLQARFLDLEFIAPLRERFGDRQVYQAIKAGLQDFLFGSRHEVTRSIVNTGGNRHSVIAESLWQVLLIDLPGIRAFSPEWYKAVVDLYIFHVQNGYGDQERNQSWGWSNTIEFLREFQRNSANRNFEC